MPSETHTWMGWFCIRTLLYACSLSSVHVCIIFCNVGCLKCFRWAGFNLFDWNLFGWNSAHGTKWCKKVSKICAICQAMCSERTRITLKRCKNPKFPWEHAPRLPYILAGYHWIANSQPPLLQNIFLHHCGSTIYDCAYHFIDFNL